MMAAMLMHPIMSMPMPAFRRFFFLAHSASVAVLHGLAVATSIAPMNTKSAVTPSATSNTLVAVANILSIVKNLQNVFL